ncbi:MAG: sigma-54-dependent Fis family transcriptional regulator, partial [Deltaproteobacteria bacterium]
MTARPRLLIADDKASLRQMLATYLGDAFEITEAASGTEALRLLETWTFDAVLSDVRMPGADGFALLERIRSHAPDTEVVLMTAYGTVPMAVEALKAGAYDFLTKPFDPEDAERILRRALERRRLSLEAQQLKDQLRGAERFGRLVGRSRPMQRVFDLLERAAAAEITVLLTGESGTGKELAARAIHEHSARSGGPFVAINCGALPRDLVESELFGHAKGAFTGAISASRGLLREAEGGTVFLDEVGELPLEAQVKLNRALQEREVRGVGEARSVPIDVRVIAATLRGLKEEVAAGRFREDLYYRLAVFPVHMPALRERPADIPLLATRILADQAAALGREVEGFEPEALAALLAHDWPGNVRELENVVARAVAVGRTRHVRLE